jgi:aspartyl aminopeptidase
VDILNKIAQADGVESSVLRYNAECLSADVTSAYDPNYASVYEKNNSGIVSCGVAMSKYTGSGGKSSSNDASAEYVSKIRRIFKENNVVWQTAELGKTDAGGGGTVAKFVARLNIDTVDLGVPVLSMHAPYEAISKADVYSCYLAFKAFIK